MANLRRTRNLELGLECNHLSHTIVSHQYAAYPLRVSPIFHLDGTPGRAYLYIMSTSPGLLAGDKLSLSLQLAAHTNLYLTEQAATKVHPMPGAGAKATTDYEIVIGEEATLEFVPEPIILFCEATLEQRMCIKLHPTAKLILSEIILPGRLARQEFYQFHYYLSRLQVTSLAGDVWFTDSMRLEGKFNSFKDSHLFATSPVLGNFIIVLPNTNLPLLRETIEDIAAADSPEVAVASSILPEGRGLVIRAIAPSTHKLKHYRKYALNCIRHLTHQPPLADSL